MPSKTASDIRETEATIMQLQRTVQQMDERRTAQQVVINSRTNTLKDLQKVAESVCMMSDILIRHMLNSAIKGKKLTEEDEQLAREFINDVGNPAAHACTEEVLDHAAIL